MSDLREDVKEHLVLALDVGGLDDALKMIDQVGEYFGYVKVGLELFTESGPEGVQQILSKGNKIFLDLKLHDIPNTVERACAVLGRMGVSMTTVHSSSLEMLQAAKKGLTFGASQAGLDVPILLAVTVLTSEVANDELFKQRLLWARDAGCDIVCSAEELQLKNELAPKVRALTPGIRLAGQDANDQTRVATPSSAIEDGSNWLVIGRAVTAADNPANAAQQVYEETLLKLDEVKV